MEVPSEQKITSAYQKDSPVSIFIILAVIVFFIAGTLLGYYLSSLKKKDVPPVPAPIVVATPSPSQITWKTYTDSKNGFIFEYPSDWQVITLPDSSAGIALKSPGYEPITSGSVTFSGEIYVKTMGNPKNLPVKDVFDTFNDTSKFWFAQFPNEEITTPLPGIKFSAIKEAGQNYTRTDYIFSSTRKLIFFTYLYKTPKVMGTFMQIIQSLKIIQPEGVTYTNTKYGFTIRFPEIWRGYEVTTHTNNGEETLCFTLKSPTGGQPFCLLNIYVFTKDTWNTLGKKPYYVTEKGQFVFTSDPQNNGCAQLNEFQCDRVKENQEIIDTFTFTSP